MWSSRSLDISMSKPPCSTRCHHCKRLHLMAVKNIFYQHFLYVIVLFVFRMTYLMTQAAVIAAVVARVVQRSNPRRQRKTPMGKAGMSIKEVPKADTGSHGRSTARKVPNIVAATGTVTGTEIVAERRDPRVTVVVTGMETVVVVPTNTAAVTASAVVVGTGTEIGITKATSTRSSLGLTTTRIRALVRYLIMIVVLVFYSVSSYDV